MLGIILLVVIALLVVWAIASYNRLIGMRNQVLNGWRQIDVQLKRRHDLIPNLVNAVAGSMDFERDTLTAVMEARAKALTATGPADAAQKEGQLSLALGRLLVVAENYPTLKSNDNVKMLQEELSATENKVGFARQFYNDIATKFNTAQQVFPTNIFAGAFGFKPSELFEITEAADRDVPIVDLSRRGRPEGRRLPRCLRSCSTVCRADRMNLYEQQSSNRRKTWLIMFAFVVFLLMLGLGFDAFYVGAAGGYVPIGSLAALGVGSVSAFASYYNGDRAVLAATSARPIEEVAAGAGEADKLKLRQLENIVDEMAIAAGLPRPRVYVVPDADPNAFATGRGPEHSSIVVTRGLLDTLDREELQGVVAHEMSHIRNLDIRVMTVVAALVGAIALLADWARRGMMWGGAPAKRQRVVAVAAGGSGDRVLRDLARGDRARAVHGADAGDDGVAAPRVSGRCVRRRADPQPDRAGACAREDRRRRRANRGDQTRLGPSLHRRSARPAHEHQGRLLVGPVRLASADGRANRGAEGDGV